MNATLFSDHNLSRSDISVRYVFQKMFSPEGTLVAVECLSRFDRMSISPENFFRYANTGLRESIFMEQLALIEKHKQWFKQNRISATINVDDHILKEGANKRGNSSRLTQSFHFFMFEPIFSPVNALNQPI